MQIDDSSSEEASVHGSDDEDQEYEEVDHSSDSSSSVEESDVEDREIH